MGGGVLRTAGPPRLGEGGAYAKHIQEQCKVKMYVKEEDGETRVELSAESQDSLRKAEGMAKDLIQAAYSKYDEWKAASSDKGGKGKGKRKDRDDGPMAKRRRY